MTHLSEEQLVLFHYGDADDHEAIRAHLETCAECRAEYEQLRRVLDAVRDMPVPERGDGYGEAVWERIRPQVTAPAEQKTVSVFRWRHMGWVAAAAAALVLAFWGGRLSQKSQDASMASGTEGAANKVLLVAMNDHLERASMILVELVNANGTDTVDLSAEQSRARDLVADNRLFRQAAQREGDRAMAALLDQVERVLMEVANAPSAMPAEDYEVVRRDIKDGELLFKVRVIQSQVSREEAEDSRALQPGAI